MITLAIDPGLRALGAALFKDQTLIHAGCILSARSMNGTRDSLMWAHMGRRTRTWLFDCLGGEFPDRIVTEKMVVVKGGAPGRKRTKWDRVNPDDLLNLTGVAGACAIACSGPNTVEFRDPRVIDWKGQTGKQTSWYRLTTHVLTEAELKVYKDCVSKVAPDYHHNTQDAIGIGCWATKRTTKGVIPRSTRKG